MFASRGIEWVYQRLHYRLLRVEKAASLGIDRSQLLLTMRALRIEQEMALNDTLPEIVRAKRDARKAAKVPTKVCVANEGTADLAWLRETRTVQSAAPRREMSEAQVKAQQTAAALGKALNKGSQGDGAETASTLQEGLR